VRFAGIRCATLVSLSAVITFLLPSATPTAAPADIGIAARYPNDKGLGSDPDVILFDDFESYTSASQLTSKWTGAWKASNLRIVTDNVYAGAKALEMQLQVSTAEVSNALDKTIVPNLDAVFIRAYTKFDSGFSVTGSGHNGMSLGGKYPGAGQRTTSGWHWLFPVRHPEQHSGRGLARRSAAGLPSHLRLLAEAARQLRRPLVSGRHGGAGYGFARQSR
jgi:hypothetical protein